MNKILTEIFKTLCLFIIGGLSYGIIEVLYKGNTHWSMLIAGGLCFVLIGYINRFLKWETPLWKQMLIGGAIVTAVEFISGCIVNLWLGWNVWDYSDMPLNLLGQISLPFTAIWVLLSCVGIILDDVLRWLLFKEAKPHYVLF